MAENINKDQWVALFRAIGLTDEQMLQWHKLFEKQHPGAHAEFLAWLNIPAGEIAEIRQMSQS